ncbi:MAG: hypothetical protein ABI761_18965 [Saprospiraceae bacterium]
MNKIQLFLLIVVLNCNPTLSQELMPPAINSSLPEFGGSLATTGKKSHRNSFYFNRTDSLRTLIDLMQAELNGNSYLSSTRLPFNTDSYRDIDPFINSDGTILYFSSNREQTDLSKGYNLWQVRLSDTGWGRPEPMPGEINSEQDEIYCSFTSKNDIYFTRLDKHSSHIYYSLLKNGKYSPAQKVDLPIHDSIRISNPAIAPDHSFLIFVSAQLNELPNADLYYSRNLGNNRWSKPINLGVTVNTSDAEFAPFVSHDKKWLYFTSERPGIVKNFPIGLRRPGDIYRIRLKNILP